MWTEVAEEQLAYEPRMEQKRRVLLEKALRFYQKRLREKRDPALGRQTALAYKRVADVLRLLGENDQAARAYREAIALLGPLAEEHGEPGHRQALADCQNCLGEVLRALSRPRQAQEAYHEAQKLQEALVRQCGCAPAYRADLAHTSYNLGILFKETNRPRDAEDALRRAVALLDEVVAQADTPAHRQHLARAHLNLGTLTWARSSAPPGGSRRRRRATTGPSPS
jgi:tetratricopeptide (TPR) repeat protein